MEDMRKAEKETIELIKNEEEAKVAIVNKKLKISEGKIKRKEEGIEQIKTTMKLKTTTFTETISEISKEFSTKIVEYTKVTNAQQNKILKLEAEWNEIHEKDTEIDNLQGIIQGMEQNNHTLAKEIQSRTTDERNKKKGNETRRNEGRQFDRGNGRRNNSDKSKKTQQEESKVMIQEITANLVQ